jgi:hypothetical protein
VKPDIPLFGSGEEITHCPSCGSRTDFLDRGQKQLHWCLNKTCEAVFYTEPDEENE